MRIVSLLPSATEALCLLLGERALACDDGPVLVGRSHECDFPSDHRLAALPVLTGARTAFRSAAQVDRDVRELLREKDKGGAGGVGGGSLYTLDAALLEALRPDLIVTQDLCAVCSIDLNAVRRVAAGMAHAPAIVSLNPTTFDAVLDDILTLGEAVGGGGGWGAARARELTVQLRQRVYSAEDYVNAYAGKPGVLVLEWTDPLFVGGHWTPQLVERAGGRHPLNPTTPLPTAGAGEGPIGQTLRSAGKSVVVSPERVVESQPEFVIVCPCGLSLKEAWRETRLLAENAWFRGLPAYKAGRVAVVDGNQMFNRPGPRLVDAFEWLVAWLNERDKLMPKGFPWRAWRVE